MEDNKVKVDLENFEGARMYNRFIQEPFPSVCVSGCFDITKLYKIKKKGHKLNTMLCYCILQAGQNIKEFHYSIKEDGLYYYKNIKTNFVTYGIDGQLYYGDCKYFDNFKEFEQEYNRVNDICQNQCVHYVEDSGAMLSTSAVIDYPFTTFSLGISPTFWDNFLMWGKFEKKFNKVKLNISLRFHHATIDGKHAALFFNELQKQFNEFNLKN